MIKYWYKQFPQYPPDHPDYWRIRLIEHSLLITTSYFLILTLINLLHFDNFQYALLDGFGLFLSLAIYCHFRKTGQVKATSWAVTIMVASLIMLFLFTTKGYSHSLLWATLIPPFSFFLVGRTWGTVVSSITFSLCVILVYQQTQNAEPFTYSMGSLFNVIEVCIAQVLILRFYEKTRFSAYQKLALRNIEIQEMAETDKLTGLYNREKLDGVLDKLLASPNINTAMDTHTISTDAISNETIPPVQYPISIAIIDIDHFKLINDTHGHLVGDKVLHELAQLLQSQMRNDDLLARWGGEEFVVVLPSTTLDDAMELSERLRQFIASKNIRQMGLTISLGIAQYQLEDSAHSLLDRADKALSH
ncbi:GGDEF domain-containing protein [Shewanella sp. OMA3-2]|uniref:GGDEF domain-containing protein n=1 Tax=Shewanella sp. OMA3-2 TaxID=2908650 RepID=UPI001F2F7B94|nr:GGDEF domain-containing protein [Shewanella sp. OMA3-2]UJF21952.1 GGDEF domain-containing protein [Shewanella sp. OMA3-2]